MSRNSLLILVRGLVCYSINDHDDDDCYLSISGGAVFGWGPYMLQVKSPYLVSANKTPTLTELSAWMTLGFDRYFKVTVVWLFV